MITTLRRSTIIAPLMSAFALFAPIASAQTAKDLVGTWLLVSVTVDRAGTKSEPFGQNPKGVLMFDDAGRFSMVIARADLPNIAGNTRSSGTTKENRAIVRGSLAYFGTYGVSPAERAFVVHVEGGTFPNWVGTDQKRIFAIVGDELRYTNSARSGGEGTALVVWQRAK
jgi:lipocalin-like protein